jgi:predicted acylesterase/phospholipase RssA
VLAAVDAATCGVFGDRLFAISGVSGGAVGGALYAASRSDLRTAQDWDKCKQLPRGERPSWLLPRLIQASTGDHLSAPLLRTLFRDLPVSLSLVRRSADGQGYDDQRSRAGALSQAWTQSYEQMLAQRTGGSAAGNSFSSGPTGAPGSSPLMLFNATSVQDGMRVLLNRASVCPADSWCGGKHASYLSMAMDSARFPLISPAAARDVLGWDQYSNQAVMTERSVVDGGYFDNTGVSTLLDVMDGLEAAKIARGRIFAILITSDPQEGRTPSSLADFSDQGALSQLLGPVSTVIQTRDGRSRLAVHELQRRLGACNVLYWSMSDKTLNPLTSEMLKVLKSNPEGDAFAALHGERQFVHEREPALGWALSQRSGQQLERFARARALPFEFGDFAHANDRKLAIGLGIPVTLPAGETEACPATPPNP